MMKNRKRAFFLVLFVLAHITLAQITEDFEDETVGTTTFTNNSQDFTITGTHYDFNTFTNGGWNGSATDDIFLDNTGETAGNDGTTVTIKTDGGTDITLVSFYVFAANTSLKNHTGTLSVTGRKDNADVYTFTKSSGFSDVEAFAPTNGFTLIDFAADGASDFSDDAVDEIVISTSGNLEYMAIDAFTWNTVSSAPTSVTVAATALLEGAWDGSSAMKTTLEEANLVAASDPYGGINTHIATASVANEAAVPDGVVDWVLVELREAGAAVAANDAARVGSAAGFLKSDGSIVATDGSSNLTISLTGNTGSSFYVVVYHRNHLPIMSLNAVSESSGVYTIDLSVSANVYESANAVSTLTGSSKVGMHAGNTDDDSDIDAVDLATWRSNNGATYSYTTNGDSDFNLDGVINAVDRNDFHQKNTSKTRQVPSS